MKKINKKIRIKKIVMTLVLLTGICAVLVTSAWATLSFVKPNDVLKETKQYADADFVPDIKIEEEVLSGSAQVSNAAKQKPRAPEPTTMVLFGSGIIGMMMSFIRKTYVVIKRGIDIIFVFAGIIVLSPGILLIALFVKVTSKGPVLYSQIRVGRDGRLFRIFKFRTMNVDAEKETGPVWAAENDNRLTPIGNFLRKAHLDELPQLINVMKGNMSIIGPRPERPVFVDEFRKVIPDYQKRLDVKPGITGLAQVWHRYDENIEDVKKKLKYDLLYIKRMCLWADLNIIMRTFRVVFTGEGAR